MATFEATWTGRFPLCEGEWHLRRNGVDVTEVIPSDLIHMQMGTRKRYVSIWRESDDGYAVYKYYFAGFSAKKWIRKNRSWIRKICKNRAEEYQLYHAIRDSDWRKGSCGRCCTYFEWQLAELPGFSQ